MSLPDRIVTAPGAVGRPAAVPPSRRSHAPTVVAGASGDAVKSPMQATIVKVAVEDGQQVVKGDLVVVLEAMKMEQPIQAHKDGVIGAINATAGHDGVAGHQLLTISLSSARSPSTALPRRTGTTLGSTRASRDRAAPTARAAQPSSLARSTMCIARAASVMLPDSDG